MPDAAELGDGIRFLLQQALGQTIRRNAAQSHAARLGVFVIDVDRISHQEQVVSAVQAGRPRTHNGYASLAAIDSRFHAVKEFVNRHARVVAYPTLDVADGDRLVDFVAAAGRFAGTHAYASACGYQRIVIEQNSRGKFRMAVAYVVDIARNIDVSRARFNALGGNCDEHVAAHGFGRFKETFAEMLHGAHESGRSRAADAAEAREHHLLGRFIDVIPVDSSSSALDQIAQSKFNEA